MNLPGVTPLHYPASYNVVSLAELLINNGANINASTIEGDTPLHCAALNGDVDMISFLIYAGADITAKECSGKTPLDLAKSYKRTLAVEILSSAENRLDYGNYNSCLLL